MLIKEYYKEFNIKIHRSTVLRNVYKRLLEVEHEQTTIFYMINVCIQARFIRLWKHLFSACPPSRNHVRLRFEKEFYALTETNINLPETSRSLYKDNVIKNTNQAAGIIAQHTFREHFSLFARVMTRIASLPSYTAYHTDFRNRTEMSNSEDVNLSLRPSRISHWNSPKIIL